MSLKGKVLVAQGGGPTAVINQSVAGVVLEARKFPQVTHVYGAVRGVTGIVNGDFLDLSRETTHNINQVADMPAAALLSTRDKPDEKYCAEIYRVLKANDVRYFFYIGGNDSSDTLRIVKDGHTEGAFSFEDLNHPTGDVDISVISDLDDPLEVEINAEHTTIARGESMTADAWVENAGDAEIEYNWYLNGAPAGTNASVSVGADLSPGSYRLDIVVRTADGRRSGSATHSFTVE